MKAFLCIVTPSLELRDNLIYFSHENLFSNYFCSSLTKSMFTRRDRERHPVLEKFYEFLCLTYIPQLDFHPLVA